MSITVQPILSDLPDTSHRWDTIAGLLDQLGGIPAERVRRNPFPGTATEEDFLYANERLGIFCELIDGTLVEKPVGSYESLLATALSATLANFVRTRKLGVVLGADGMLRLFGGNVRMPDVSFVPKERFTNGLPKGLIWQLSPALAVEVLSASNTVAEISRKTEEYFASDVSLVWIVDPVARTVTVYVKNGPPSVKNETQVLDGGAVLHGFSLQLSELFGVMDL